MVVPSLPGELGWAENIVWNAKWNSLAKECFTLGCVEHLPSAPRPVHLQLRVSYQTHSGKRDANWHQRSDLQWGP